MQTGGVIPLFNCLKKEVDTIQENGEVCPNKARARYHGYISNSYKDIYQDNYDSEIKQKVDIWYENNLKDYTSYLQDSIFCNDRSLASGTASDWNQMTTFGPYQRLTKTNKASLICPRKEDKFTKNTEIGNGELHYPISLISADEVVYAGGNVGYTNELYYLNSTISYATISPRLFAAYNIELMNYIVLSGGNLYEWNVSNLYIRPVINLKSNIQIVSGDGTKLSPYVIATNL